MILPQTQDTIHKAMMYRLLMGILDDKQLSTGLYFKGGTCAAMFGFLDRFSIDLDFDLKPGTNKEKMRKILKKLFASLNFSIKEESNTELFFVLKYDAPREGRNTLKVSIVAEVIHANIYRPLYLSDIKRYAICQTKETMFANKLVAVVDRYKKYKTIAGRDIYDIHHFFLQGGRYNKEVIVERTGKSVEKYFKELVSFIEKKVTNRFIHEDLNYLLPPEKFKAIKNILKIETLTLLKDEIVRISG